jgi:hypothetical protein
MSSQQRPIVLTTSGRCTDGESVRVRFARHRPRGSPPGAGNAGLCCGTRSAFKKRAACTATKKSLQGRRTSWNNGGQLGGPLSHQGVFQ